MSLYGALFASVSGLRAQGTKVGIISDNIANVNTVGYKEGEAYFQSLVVNSGTTGAYSPGGVLASNLQAIDKQGLIQATDAPTDIAISGNGLFVVNSQEDGSGTPQYTRAGSFRQDSLGNFKNAAGFFLLGWPLDRDGRLPGEVGNLNTTSSANLDSLEVVNVESASGVAAATTTIGIGANLNASEVVFPGAGATINLDANHTANANISATDIIADGGPNGLARGDEITLATGAGQTYTFTYDGFLVGRDVTSALATGDGGIVPTGVGTGNILDATTASQAFLGVTGTSGFTVAARSFTITNATSGTVTFTYTPTSPNTLAGQFNNLDTLAQAIDEVNGLTARIINNQLYLGAENASEAITVSNGDATGTVLPPLSGIDWVSELGIAAGPGDATIVAGSNRFSTLQGFADLVNASTGISATVNNPLSDTTVDVRVDDPLDTLSIYDGDETDITTVTNTGSLIDEFGFATLGEYVAGPGVENALIGLGPAYDPTGANGSNLASGDITAQFSRNIRVFDALGSGHDLRMSFIKIATNTWAVEIHALPESDVNSTLVDGQVATGTVIFNGDGSLRSASAGLTAPININWTNGAASSVINLDLGTAGQPFGTPGATTIGLTDGLTQFSADYNVSFVDQNGSPVGELVSVAIDPQGNVIASYSNGETRQVYRLPIADFANPNGLAAQSGNVYSQTRESGEVNLREAGTNGVGKIVSAALESSNVDLAEQLTDIIVAQRAYQASTRVISASSDLLESLNNL